MSMKVVIDVDDFILTEFCDVHKGEIYDVIECKEVWNKKRGNHKQYFIENSQKILVKLYDTEVREIKFKNKHKINKK